MSLRALALMTTLAITAVLSAKVSDAPAATLWTTPAHTVHASSFGFTATAPSATFTTASGPPVTGCQGSSINFYSITTLLSGGTVKAAANAATFASCAPTAVKATFPEPRGWTLFFSGTGAAIGASTCWPSIVTSFGLDVGPSAYFGSLTTGGTACQPTAGTSPITVRLTRAGTLTSGLQLTATYTFTGAAATFSLSN
jgi:hypothetical protein